MGHPPRLFPHHWGPGKGRWGWCGCAEARGGLLALQQSFRAVAGKRYGPLFSPCPPVATNPGESEQEGGRAGAELEMTSDTARDFGVNVIENLEGYLLNWINVNVSLSQTFLCTSVSKPK